MINGYVLACFNYLGTLYPIPRYILKECKKSIGSALKIGLGFPLAVWSRPKNQGGLTEPLIDLEIWNRALRVSYLLNHNLLDLTALSQTPCLPHFMVHNILELRDWFGRHGMPIPGKGSAVETLYEEMLRIERPDLKVFKRKFKPSLQFLDTCLKDLPAGKQHDWTKISFWGALLNTWATPTRLRWTKGGSLQICAFCRKLVTFDSDWPHWVQDCEVLLTLWSQYNQQLQGKLNYTPKENSPWWAYFTPLTIARWCQLLLKLIQHPQNISSLRKHIVAYMCFPRPRPQKPFTPTDIDTCLQNLANLSPLKFESLLDSPCIFTDGSMIEIKGRASAGAGWIVLTPNLIHGRSITIAPAYPKEQLTNNKAELIAVIDVLAELCYPNAIRQFSSPPITSRALTALAALYSSRLAKRHPNYVFWEHITNTATHYLKTSTFPHPVQTQITIYSDSKYLVDIWNGEATPRKNTNLVVLLLKLKSVCPNIQVAWIKGHNKSLGNETADLLAKTAHLHLFPEHPGLS